MFERLRLRGHLDATARVFDREGKNDFEVEIGLAKVAAAPIGSRFQFDDLAGTATVGRDSLRVDGISGTRGDSRLTWSGQARWPDGRTTWRWRIEGDQMRFEEPLLDLLTTLAPSMKPMAERVALLQQRHKPVGQFGGHLDLTGADETPTDFRLSVRPAKIEFDLSDRRVAFHDMSGAVTIDADHITFDRLGAAFEKGRTTLKGSWQRGGDRKLDLYLDARVEGFERVTRSLLPAPLVRSIDQLNLNGTFETKGTRITSRSDERGARGLEVKGEARVADASAILGVALTDVQGRLAYGVVTRHDRPWPRIDLTLEADRLRAAGRLVKPLEIAFDNAEEPEVLAIRKLEGRCYGGTVLGSGKVALDRDGRHDVRLVLQDAQLAPILDPKASAEQNASANKPLEVYGQVSASLAMGARRDGDALRRTGRGEITINNANFYEFPLGMAVVQLLNLSLPSSNAFNRAVAQFVINGDELIFDRLQFDSEAIQIVGSGTMKIDTHELDLDMVSRNPSGLRLGHLSALIGKVKDELIAIHIGGTLAKPDASVTTLRGTQKSWLNIFGGKSKPQKLTAK